MQPSLTRRSFLRRTGALAVAPFAVPRQDPAPATRPRRTLRKAVMYGMVGPGKTVLEKFQILKECGFEGVEMDSPSGIPIAEILAAREATGIVVHGLVDSVHWQHHLNHPSETVRERGRKALEHALRDARALGAGTVLLVPAVVSRTQPYEDAWTLSQEQIRAALPVAAECRVQIAVENVWNQFLLSPLEARRYVDELQSPWAVWYFDIGNVVTYGWPEQWIRALGPRIRKVHVKEYSRRKRDAEGLWKGFQVELLEGDVGWPAVMQALDDVGYSTAPEGRWATAEVGGGDAARLRAVAAAMDRIFAL
ncbi:MAG: sugar phosphate isomerase/epimerase [Planctomycetes bacterium]|nr:sugar phosphate isomerase/epimerase [Planctomycetota bacterium]